jgi:hypothetical protein
MKRSVGADIFLKEIERNPSRRISKPVRELMNVCRRLAMEGLTIEPPDALAVASGILWIAMTASFTRTWSH